jgi:membrane peptidoglycan carboxypeptidase
VRTPDFTGPGRPRRRESGRGGRPPGDVYDGADDYPPRDGRRRGGARGGTGYAREDGYGRGNGRGRDDGYGRTPGRGAGNGPGAGNRGADGYGRTASRGDDYDDEGYGYAGAARHGDDHDDADFSYAAPGRRGEKNRPGSGRRSTRHGATVDHPGNGGADGGPPRGRGRGGKAGKPGKRKGSWWRHWSWKKVVALVLGTVGAIVLTSAILVVVEYASTPIPTDVAATAVDQASTVYFSNGKTVVGTFGSTNRQVLTSNQIPVQLKNAVLAAEDRNFYNEGGVSPTGIMRAAYKDLTSSGTSLQGGSTITEQFVKNYYANISSAQTISNKIKEIFIAIKLARQKSKDWILTQYLNTIYFGGGAYGVGAAAETYFGKPASKLSISQDAMIAALLNAPGIFDPTPGSAGYKPLVARWQYVLQGMVTMGKLTRQQASAQKFPKVVTASQPSSSGWTGYNGYIMQAVYNELRYTYGYSQSRIYNGGLHIVTTFSQSMMNALYTTVSSSEKLMKLDGKALPWYAHVGAVLEQPGTGAIVAMYSGPSYSAPAKYCLKIHCQVDMALGNREQVGSSFKPYVLSAARAQGMSVKTSVLDGTSPLCVPGDQYSTTYSVPANGTGAGACPSTPYGWHAFSNDAGDSGSGGPQSVSYATAMSLNTAYTDLTHRVGTQNVINMAKSFGVDTSAYPGGSNLQHDVGQVGIALGQNALTVGEQANTFAVLAANGQYVTPHVVQQVTVGTSLIPAKVTHRQVLTPAQAADVNYPLSFDTIYGTGTAAAMTDGRPVIGKTGTTSSAQSAFFLGAIPQYSLAIGMFTDQQNSAANGQTLTGIGGLPGYGGDWPARIWHAFAEKEFAKLPVEHFGTPAFGGTSWNLMGNGQGLTSPVKPKSQPASPAPSAHPTPSKHPHPTPSGSCTPVPLGPQCGSPPPSKSPGPSPSPSCSRPGQCKTTPPPGGGTSGGSTKASALPAADPVRTVRTGGSG